MSCKIVYVFNGYQWLWRQLLLSMTSLRRFVKENIMVFYAPPRFQEHINWLKPRCDLHLVDAPLNSQEFRSAREYYRNQYWGHPMKLHAYRIASPVMIHLDCDTVINKNILEILKIAEGNYDLAVAKWEGGEKGRTLMKENCEKLNLPHWPVMMDGFIICKNHAHLKFKPIYAKYLRMVAMGEVKPHDSIHIGLHAFNLAINHFRREGYKVVAMPPKYHTYGGAEYVTHLVHKHFAVRSENNLFSEELHTLKMVGA